MTATAIAVELLKGATAVVVSATAVLVELLERATPVAVTATAILVELLDRETLGSRRRRNSTGNEGEGNEG